MSTEQTVNEVFRKWPGEYMTEEEQLQNRAEFDKRAVDICRRHLCQTLQQIERLKLKYSAPIIGTLPVYQLMQLLAGCVDPSDTELYGVSQLTHCLQIANSMREDGVHDDMIIVGLVHDIGKLMLLLDEDPANIVGPNEPVGEHKVGIGLDAITITWNHDEFGYDRLKKYLSYEQGWLLRYHSLRFDFAEKYMNERDKELHATWLVRFREYDLHTKSLYVTPTLQLRDFKELIERYFPTAVIF